MRRPLNASCQWILLLGAASSGAGLRAQSTGEDAAERRAEGSALAWLASHERGRPNGAGFSLENVSAPRPGPAHADAESLAPHASQRKAALLPWVSASQWDFRPTDPGAEIYSRTAVTSWAAFEESLSFCLSTPPAYVEVAERPLFHVRTPRETIFSSKLRKLIQAKAYREIRRRVKREWKSTFLDDPSMTYRDYESRLYQINNIGREPREYDDVNVESMALELKQEFLGKGEQDGEADIPLLAWGPMTVTDTGSLKLDVGALTRSEDEEDEEIEVGEESHKPLIATKDYRFHTTFQVDVDPMRAVSQNDPWGSLRRYGVDFELDFLSDVLHRELLSFEVELQSSGSWDDFKGFFNLVLKAR